jgi:hypothetical protein
VSPNIVHYATSKDSEECSDNADVLVSPGCLLVDYPHEKKPARPQGYTPFELHLAEVLKEYLPDRQIHIFAALRIEN